MEYYIGNVRTLKQIYIYSLPLLKYCYRNLDIKYCYRNLDIHKYIFLHSYVKTDIHNYNQFDMKVFNLLSEISKRKGAKMSITTLKYILYNTYLESIFILSLL